MVAGSAAGAPGGSGEAAAAPASGATAVTNVASENWAGYAATGAAGSFTSVSSSWPQPAVGCGATATFSSFWVGLDGDGTPTVEQTGTEADCTHGAASYQGWYEIFPNAPVFLPNPVQPGDAMSASVVSSGSGTFTLTLSDATQGGVRRRGHRPGGPGVRWWWWRRQRRRWPAPPPPRSWVLGAHGAPRSRGGGGAHPTRSPGGPAPGEPGSGDDHARQDQRRRVEQGDRGRDDGRGAAVGRAEQVTGQFLLPQDGVGDDRDGQQREDPAADRGTQAGRRDGDQDAGDQQIAG